MMLGGCGGKRFPAILWMGRAASEVALPMWGGIPHQLCRIPVGQPLG